MKFLLLGFTTFLTLSFLANTNNTNSKKIKEVTIYSSSASVKYEGSFNLIKGKNTILFSELTPNIIENSTKVRFEDPNLKILSVTERINFESTLEVNSIQKIKDSLETLKSNIEIINYQIEANNKEKELLFKSESIGGLANGVKVEEIEKAADFYHDRYLKLNESNFKLNKEKKRLESNTAVLNSKLRNYTSKSSKQVSEIVITVLSNKSTQAKAELSFITPNAGWAPVYNINFNGLDQPIGLDFKANIFNATNTNWNNVKITLSTASPTIGFNIPTLEESNTVPSNRDLKYNNSNISYDNVQVSTNTEEYEIEENRKILSNGKPYLIDVKEFEMNAIFSFLVIPKLDNHAFMLANIPSWSNYNLMSAKTNIYNNGTYLGNTFLKTTTTNDTLQVYLGKDNLIQCHRNEITDENLQKSIGSTASIKTDVSITVTNNHEKEVTISLLDQVPAFFDDDDIKINLKDINEDLISKSDGVINWSLKLQNKEKHEIKFGYTIKYPKKASERVSQKRKTYRTISCPSF